MLELDFAFFPEQLIDCINMARDLIKTRLKEPHKIPQDKKMIDLIDDLIKKNLSKYSHCRKLIVRG